MSIYKAINSVMADIEAIGKDKTTSMPNGASFNYRGIDQVYNAIQPLLAKHKVFTIPRVIEQHREERTNAKGTTIFYSRVKMEYTFYTEDGTGVSCSVIGEGMDSGDKATNKAMAIAHKYALLQTFCIPTGDMIDPDSEVHEVQPKQEAKKPEPKKPPLRAFLESKQIDSDNFYAHFKITSAEQANKLLENKAELEKKVNEFIKHSDMIIGAKQ